MAAFKKTHKCFMGNYLVPQNVVSHCPSSLQPTSTGPTVHSLPVQATVVCHLQMKIPPTLNTNDKSFSPPLKLLSKARYIAFVMYKVVQI